MKYLLLSFFLLLNGLILACDCKFQGYFGQVAPQAELVVLVQVSKVITPKQPAGSTLQEMQVELTSVYKGTFAKKQLTITHDKLNSCLESFSSFTIGDYYLLALKKVVDGEQERYEIAASTCGEYWLHVHLPLQVAVSEKYERLRVMPLQALQYQVNPASGQTAVPAEYPEADTAITKKELIAQFSGMWLNKTYLLKALKDRSFYSQREFDSRFFGFQFDKTELTSKKPQLHGFSVHEGGDDVALSYDVKTNRFRSLDPTFEIYRIDSLTIKMISQNERNSVTDFVQTGEDVETTLRSLFLSGTYVTGDTTLTLQADGTVSGWGQARYFDVMYDFVGPIDFDAVLFYPSEEESWNHANGQLYRYAFKENQLILTPIDTSKEDSDDWTEGTPIVLTKTR